MDRQWWDIHHKEVAATFKGARYSTNPIAVNYGVTRLLPPKHKSYGNSGAGCISLAAASGAHRIIMLGFDCQHTNGVTHWHGSHPKGLGDAGSINKWPAKFRALASDVTATAEIWNASRETALDMFTRKDLIECLALP